MQNRDDQRKDQAAICSGFLAGLCVVAVSVVDHCTHPTPEWLSFIQAVLAYMLVSLVTWLILQKDRDEER